MAFIQASLIALAVILCLMTVLWIVSALKQDASIIDPVWGVGFAIVAWAMMAMSDEWTGHAWILATLVSVWGLRLSAYLFWRNHGKPEDHRYKAMRAKHGEKFKWISLFTVFLLQACLLWFISLPVQAGIFSSTSALSPLVALGGILWLIGFCFESIGDCQLAAFQADPDNRGKVLDKGLWRFTRHPNYFGDFCIWWGLYMIAAAGGAWWTIASPVLMSFLLLKVSGVSLLESDIEERRPKYREYKRRTNAFFPGPAKE